MVSNDLVHVVSKTSVLQDLILFWLIFVARHDVRVGWHCYTYLMHPNRPGGGHCA